MELKKYQKSVIDQLREYVLEMRKFKSAKAAGVAFMTLTDQKYNWITEIGTSPFVCIKVPTGGGKTLIATYAVGTIFKEYLGARNDRGLVIWFVPSDAIRRQTVDNLRNRNHPFRAALDARFNGAVKVMDITEAKSIKRDDLVNNLCVVVSTLGAFRREEKDALKVFQNNGALITHFEELPAKIEGLEKDSDGQLIYSLANVIKLHNPLVIIDEGHNVQTDLSFDMLQAVNPSFVLELTATPKGKSNVLVNISAQELKKEKMIKMPLYLSNQVPWQNTIYSGLKKLKELASLAEKNKKSGYIRPIMLIQAEQEIANPKKVYVEKIVNFLTSEAKIPRAEIAIQTAKVKELPAAEVLAGTKCPIRYIVTVNALKEGWDCPFAYVLVSVSNLGARLTVEQTIGRIMRLPYVKEHSHPALNSAYIFAATKNFSQTSDMIIKSLQNNGYDVIPAGPSVDVRHYTFKKRIADKQIQLPFLTVVPGGAARRLEFIEDLIGNRPLLLNKNASVNFEPSRTDCVERIDIGHDGQLVRDKAGQSELVYHHQALTAEDLLLWLQSKIQRSFISISEMQKFIAQIVKNLLQKRDLKILSARRYELVAAIDQRIDNLIEAAAKKKFAELLKRKHLKARGDYFYFEKEIVLTDFSAENFSKHLYERAGQMNKEELALAWRFDTLDKVRWWFRNPAGTGFYLQGWRTHKFYPDFIVKTTQGKYFVVEYKGEHLEDAPDADYKKELGQIWAKLAGKNYHFDLVKKQEVDKLIKQISVS